MVNRFARAFAVAPLKTALALAALALAGACAEAPPDNAPVGLPIGTAAHPGQFLVSAANPHASRAGAEILAAGGSAVDAAIAVQLVLTLVEPQASGIGGGAFMLYFDQEGGDLHVYDGREIAPASATPDLFLDEDGAPLGFLDAIVGGRSVGVPGVVAMLAQAHARHGVLPWAKLFDPAIALSEDGFDVSPRLHRMIDVMPRLDVDPAMRDYLFLEGKTPLPVGHRLRNPEYARTLRLLADNGPDAFYRGEIAQAIVAAVSEAPAAPRPMTLEDLANYRAVKRDELCGRYRQFTVCGMRPPSSGGVTVLQILGMLETFDMAALEPGSAEATHLLIEASRLAYADRNLYLGDTDFVPAPIDAMLNAEYLAARATLIDFDAAMEAPAAGNPEAFVSGEDGTEFAPGLSPQPPSTSHFSIIDPRGNAVSMTTSVEAPFGSHLMAGGFVLNNQLTDFSFIPEVDGLPVANAVAPGKRPRSSMSPTIVFDANGSLYALIGSPGGPAIIGYVVKTLIGVLDWELPMQEAMDLPNVTVARGRTSLEAGGFEDAVLERLRALGHEINERPLTSGLHGAVVTPDGFDGGADSRREGLVIVGERGAD